MLFTVVISELKTFLAKMLLHKRVDDDLLADGVASDLPCQLTRPTLLSIFITGSSEVLVVVFVHLHGKCSTIITSRFKKVTGTSWWSSLIASVKVFCDDIARFANVGYAERIKERDIEAVVRRIKSDILVEVGLL